MDNQNYNAQQTARLAISLFQLIQEEIQDIYNDEDEEENFLEEE